MAASVVSGSGLYAVGAAGTPDTEVGYRVADKLCDKTLWPGLSSRFAKSPDRLSPVTKHPAMDTADCFGELQALGQGTQSAQLELSVVLHKQTDLTAEFEARRAPSGSWQAAVANRPRYTVFPASRTTSIW